ncbi:nucleotide pyrophosphohydrolase [Pseudoalteromonas phage H101]|uniref:Uncharacterized protein n=1 Tax=Pseudoalteromonas phage H101 TaxID=1654919 RepID=A0A0H4IP03_9CAUD|nr:nucleotide pyrophosphohydrolase [Pseudoalteromonas phage H101]AKO61057.1 hypothetical protein [Pseudoalteromonas phage H101]
MKRPNKEQLSAALLSLYKSTYEFNTIAGKTLSSESLDSQKGLVTEEVKEMIIAKITSDSIEFVDGVIDGIIVSSFAVMCQDGDTTLLQDAPKYINHDNKSQNTLVGEAVTYLLNEDYLNLLGTLEDLAYLMEGDTIHNLYNISESNLSKYVPVELVDDPDTIAFDIESQGRYSEIEYSVAKMTCGKEVYVFTAGYDVENKKAYPVAKVVKPKGFFKEPQLIL